MSSYAYSASGRTDLDHIHEDDLQLQQNAKIVQEHKGMIPSFPDASPSASPMWPWHLRPSSSNMDMPFDGEGVETGSSSVLFHPQ